MRRRRRRRHLGRLRACVYVMLRIERLDEVQGMHARVQSHTLDCIQL